MKRVHVVLPPASSSCIRVFAKDLTKYDQLSPEEQFLFLHVCEAAAQRTPSGQVRFPRPKTAAWIVSYKSDNGGIDVDIEEATIPTKLSAAKPYMPWILSLLALAEKILRFFL